MPRLERADHHRDRLAGQAADPPKPLELEHVPERVLTQSGEYVPTLEFDQVLQPAVKTACMRERAGGCHDGLDGPAKPPFCKLVPLVDLSNEVSLQVVCLKRIEMNLPHYARGLRVGLEAADLLVTPDYSPVSDQVESVPAPLR